MNLKNIFTGVAFTAITFTSYAQYNQDALRFSRSQHGSTSRIKAIGNSSIAVGGDASAISNNPAGLGFFNSSEFSLSPELNFSTMSSDYFGSSEKSKKNTFNLSNASIVFNTKSRVPNGYDTQRGLLNVNFGISYTRTNNFFQNSSFAGTNKNSSIADYYAEIANTQGFTKANPLADWAFDHFLIDSVAVDNQNKPLYGGNVATQVKQLQDRINTGGQSEINFAAGSNISNKFYIGMGIGIATLRYNSETNFIENGDQFIDKSEYNHFFRTNQNTTGSGFNLKLGMIYKPVESVRIGANFTSPTYYTIEDQFSMDTETNYLDLKKNYTSSTGGPYSFDYNLRTPLKVGGGIAVFIQQHGFISADIEYVDYPGMKLEGYAGESQDNALIANLYQGAVNARVGGEAKLDNLYLRAGYNYQGNPEKGIGSPIHTVSGGLGYRMNNFFVDATFTSSSHNYSVFPYEFTQSKTAEGESVYSPEAKMKSKFNNAFLTVGFKF